MPGRETGKIGNGTPYRIHLPTRNLYTRYVLFIHINGSIRPSGCSNVYFWQCLPVVTCMTPNERNEKRGCFSYISRRKTRPADFVFTRFRTGNRRPGTLRNISLEQPKPWMRGGGVCTRKNRAKDFQKSFDPVVSASYEAAQLDRHLIDALSSILYNVSCRVIFDM